MSCEKKDEPIKIIPNSRPIYVIEYIEPEKGQSIELLNLSKTPVVGWIVETSYMGEDKDMDSRAQPVIPGNLPAVYAIYDSESTHWEVFPHQAAGKDLITLDAWFNKNAAEEKNKENTG